MGVKTTLAVLNGRVDSLGVEFHSHGDSVIYLWPWRRGDRPRAKFISVLASGTGEFGDARFDTLAEIANFWHQADGYVR